MENFIILDTETTGLDNDDEVIELSIINQDNQILLNERFKPLKNEFKKATRIHGIEFNDFELLSDEVKTILNPIKHKIGTFKIDYSDYLPIYNFNIQKTIKTVEKIDDIEYLEIQIENLKKELEQKKSIKNNIVLDIKKLIKEHNLTTNDLF